jgi:uncharacterized repeat protein (TIGR04076 family)
MDWTRILDKISRPIVARVIKNRWGYTDEEFRRAMDTGLFDILSVRALMYWLKAEPVCSRNCSACHNEGRPLYFNPMGMLVRHKCPPAVCIHGLSQLSPLIYDYYDHMIRGADPREMVFDHVTCTDLGLEHGGMGSNLFRLSYERMPLMEVARFLLSMAPYLFVRNRRARGECRALEEAPRSGGPEPTEFMKRAPLSEEELEAFLASPKRVRRLRSIEKFQDRRIVVKVVSSSACLAGHREGDVFLLDLVGRVLPESTEKGVCIMALAKIWWRVLLMLERLAAAVDGDVPFTSPLFDLPMNCYGAGLPLGACGEILMKVELR